MARSGRGSSGTYELYNAALSLLILLERLGMRSAGLMRMVERLGIDDVEEFVWRNDGGSTSSKA